MVLANRHRLQLLFVAGLLFIVLFHRSLFSSTDNTPGPSAFRRPITYKPSSVDWSKARQFFPPESTTPLPRGLPKLLPRIQAKPKSFARSEETKRRQAAVRDVFVRSWNAYKQQAWQWDELQPVSGGGKNTFGGWAATLVDSLDSLWILGLYDDFYKAAQAAVELDWANTTETSANLFETTIRHLGGLLSAYDLSGEEALLDKARELGDMLYMAFDTPNRIPGFWINFEDARAGRQVAGSNDPSASPTSLCLEFTRLAQLTGQDKYYSAVDHVRDFLYRTQDSSRLPGMWPRTINFQDERVDGEIQFTIGALADSLYEYFPKMYILTNGEAESYSAMYRKSSRTIRENILFRPMLPDQLDILLPGDVFVQDDGRVDRVPETQHLGCFAGAMFLLGGKTFDLEPDVDVGARLARGCAWAYGASPAGLMPEIAGLLECPTLAPCAWDEARWRREGDPRLREGFRHARDPRYVLRPEAVESIFYLYRVTGREELRDTAWSMFRSILRATETPIAYSAIADVRATGAPDKLDSMESFWLSETLKYFYLIFSPPDLISLDEWVLNTEAHPFRCPK